MRTTNDQPDVQERRKKMQAIEDRPSVLPETDEDGFLKKEITWTKDVAQLMAPNVVHGDLTEDHWKVVKSLRDYYIEFGVPTPVAKLRKDTGMDLEQVKALFPAGLGRGAVKVAGLPRPPGLYPL